MKKTRQFVPLLKLMLGYYRYGPWAILLWWLSYGIVVAIACQGRPMDWWQEHRMVGFNDGQVMTAVFLWCFLGLISTPLPTQLLAGIVSLEFIFTRGLDRATWLRAERVGLILIATLPLMANYLIQIAMGSPSETRVFAGWMLWLALCLIFLVGGYFAVVFRLWQGAGWHHSKSAWRPWLGGAMIFAPSFSVVPLFIYCVTARADVLEQSYLLYKGHSGLMMLVLIALVAMVQPLSERNIRRLEFEFT